MRLLPQNKELGWTPFAWLVYLSFFVSVPFVRDRISVLEVVLTLAAVAVFLPLYFLGYWIRGRRVLWIIAAMMMLGFAFVRWNPGAATFFIYAASFCAYAGDARFAFRLVAAIEVVVIALMFILDVSRFQAMWPVIFVALVGGINIHYAQVGRSNARLRLAQEEIEQLAKVAERERIARDLHDLLGHTLSLITIKSELASRLADRDVARAVAEIRDVERISRETLAQVRDAVRGYRSEGLQQEVAAAHRMLDAGGIRAEISIPPVQLPPQLETILSLALREAVTNVVRHARASTTNIELTHDAERIRLTIADDGVGKHDVDGSGLSGMRERIAALGGTLTIDSASGTKLTLDLPMHAAEVRSA